MSTSRPMVIGVTGGSDPVKQRLARILSNVWLVSQL